MTNKRWTDALQFVAVHDHSRTVASVGLPFSHWRRAYCWRLRICGCNKNNIVVSTSGSDVIMNFILYYVYGMPTGPEREHAHAMHSCIPAHQPQLYNAYIWYSTPVVTLPLDRCSWKIIDYAFVKVYSPGSPIIVLSHKPDRKSLHHSRCCNAKNGNIQSEVCHIEHCSNASFMPFTFSSVVSFTVTWLWFHYVGLTYVNVLFIYNVGVP